MTADAVVGILDAGGRVVGTGFFVTGDGLVATSAHVVEEVGVDAVAVRTSTEPRVPAELVVRDEATDLALLRIDRHGCEVLGLSARWRRLARVRTHGFPRGWAARGYDHGMPVSMGRALDVASVGGASCLVLAGADVDRGLSGAPIVDGSGHAVAVQRWMDRPLLPGELRGTLPGSLVRRLEKRNALATPTGALLDLGGTVLAEAPPPGIEAPFESLPASPAPSLLLQARYRVVGFRSRDEELAELAGWCHSERVVGARLLVGPGGVGKTRLAAELADSLDRVGWVVGFLAAGDGRQDAAHLADLAHCHRRVLVVVDYAETRTTQLEALLTRLAASEDELRRRAPAGSVRVLAVVRNGGDWWDGLCGENGRFGRIAGPEARQKFELRPLAPDLADRRAAFDSARTTFAARLGRPVLEAGTPDLGDPAYESVLALHIAAYLALDPPAPPRPTTRATFDDLADGLLRHERKFWTERAAAALLPVGPDGDEALQVAVVAATLCGAADKDEAIALLARVPDLDGLPLGPLAEWLHGLYPPMRAGAAVPPYLGSLQPDRLAETLVVSAVWRRPKLLAALLTDATRAQMELALNLLDRASGEHKELDDVLIALLGPWRRRLLRVGFELTRRGGFHGSLPRIIAPWIVVREPHPWRTAAAFVAVGASCLVIGLVVGRWTAPSPEEAATATSTTTVDRSSTSTSTVRSTTTSRPESVYLADFDDPTEQPFPVFDSGVARYEAGRFVMAFDDRVYLSLYVQHRFEIDSSVRVEIDAEELSDRGAEYGLGCGVVPSEDLDATGDELTYEATIEADGSWAIQRVDPDVDPEHGRVLSDGRGHRSVRGDGPNRLALEVRRDGSSPVTRLRFLVNGEEVAAVDDADGFACPEVGLVVRAGSGSAVDVRFDNLAVTKL